MLVLNRVWTVICVAAITVSAAAQPSFAAGQDLLPRVALPSLSAWTKLHTNALINAQTVDDLNDAADAFLSQNISIIVNGINVTRDQFLQTLVVNLPGRTSSGVTYKAILEDPLDPANPTSTGWVGVFLKTKNIYPTRKLIESSSNNVLIEQDPSIPVPPAAGGAHGAFDGRRVTVFNSITVIDP